MGLSVTQCLTAALAAVSAVSAAPAASAAAPATASTNDFGSFANPSIHVRPRFRYWVPDASIDLAKFADDIAEIGRVGCSGIELLGYYLYGHQETNGPVAVDWTKYSWGTPAWKNLSDAALAATKANGLIMDYALGPNQGAGVPSKPEADGLMWTLQPFNTSVPVGGTFNGVLPGWGTGKLVSASTGLVTMLTNGTGNPPTNATLKTSSLQDVTGQVSSSGHLNIKFPSGSGENYVVFAYYLIHPGYRELPPSDEIETTVPQSPITSFVYNGSWVVDHFSSAGAQAVIDFWETYLLGGNTKELLREVGHYSWEDSQEYGDGYNIFWTPGMLDQFESGRGYSVQKYLPILFASDNIGFKGPTPSNPLYVTDEPDAGFSHAEDFRQTVTELNQMYLTTLNTWTRTLGNNFSAQVGYNLALDMLQEIPNVDIPECESLGFNHLIDGYKQYTGAANLAGKPVISSELGAIPGAVFQQTLPELIWDVKRSIVGGVNQFVYHGFPYSGNYPNTTWPVFATFQYEFSNMHGPHQPAWDYYPNYMNWTARVQYVSQSGIEQCDVAIYLKNEDWYNQGPNFGKFASDDLVNAGYCYEYLSPNNFGLPAAQVSNKIFAPSQQAFKAMVVPSNSSMTVYGVQRLTDFANAGLPIFFAGGLPTAFYGYNVSGEAYTQSAIQSLSKMSNVYTVNVDDLASALASHSIQPRTSTNANTTWYTNWRQDGSTAYAFIYNDATGIPLNGGFSTGNVTFEATGAPHWYDAWTGDITPVAAYTSTQTTTTVSMQLAGNQSAIVAFLPGAQSAHVAEAPGVASVSGNSVTIKSDQAGTGTFTNGSTFSVKGGAAPIMLTNWNLTLESWTPGSNLFDVNGARTNSSHQLTSLVPWSSFGAQNVSGRGFYSTTFSWSSKDGAFLDLGGIVQTAQATVNGQALPPLDPTWARTDIGSYLKHGTNTVEVVVSSTLGNAAAPLWPQLRSGGTLAEGPVPGGDEYGLISPAMVVPYTTTQFAL